MMSKPWHLQPRLGCTVEAVLPPFHLLVRQFSGHRCTFGVGGLGGPGSQGRLGEREHCLAILWVAGKICDADVGIPIRPPAGISIISGRFHG